MILGIDEVGRGPWAGPLVVGAVVLGGAKIEGLTDSKKLSKKRRDILDVEIREKASGFGLGWIDASIIDKVGLSKALEMATKLAVEQIEVPYSEIVIDGTVNFLKGTTKEQYVVTMKKADLLVPSVSAASIIAKVARDKFMADQDEIHKGYGFKNHVGYGTRAHSDAINKLGITKLHRLSFAPLKKYSATSKKDGPLTSVKKCQFSQDCPVASVTSGQKVTTKMIGDGAEDVAARYLKKTGHKILDRNWKTRFCEIDIVSTKSEAIYFTEVKYRKKPDQGGGLAAITNKKLRQMKFAAEFYSLANQISDTNLRLAVITSSGRPAIIDEFLEVE